MKTRASRPHHRRPSGSHPVPPPRASTPSPENKYPGGARGGNALAGWPRAGNDPVTRGGSGQPRNTAPETRAMGGRTFGFLRNPRAPNGGRGDPKSSPAKASTKAGKCALIHRLRDVCAGRKTRCGERVARCVFVNKNPLGKGAWPPLHPPASAGFLWTTVCPSCVCRDWG